MSQQGQNAGQGNVGGNSRATGLYQYQQQHAQQHHNNHAIAAHIQARANFNGNQQQQHVSQHQPRQLVNANSLQGMNHAQMNHLRTMQQQLQADIATQQNIQASMNVNQQQSHLQQQHQQQHLQQQQQQNIQAPLNMNQQQRQQLQPAENSANTDVIKDLFSQLKSINQKLENFSSPTAAERKTPANEQRTKQQSQPARVNNGVSNDAPVSRPVNTIVQLTQRQAPPIPLAHTSVNTSRPAANQIAQRHLFDAANTVNQPLGSAPLTAAVPNPLLQSGQPQNSMTAGQYARLRAQSHLTASSNATKSNHWPTTANTTLNPKENPEPTQNGQAKKSPANGAKQSYTRKQPPIATKSVAGSTLQAKVSPFTNIRPQVVKPTSQARPNTATSALAPIQPTAATSTPDPNMITGIRILAYKMGQVVVPLPLELAVAYWKLHAAQRFTMENTLVFKFENRARKANEKGEITGQASFFLSKLAKASSLVERKMKLVGMKCNLCNLRDSYIVGSTSFVDIESPRTVTLFADVIESRMKHMISCPDCNQMNKSILASYVPNIQDIQNMRSFAEKWLLVLHASYFAVARPNALVTSAPHQRIEVTDFLPITEDSIYEDLVSSMEMGRATGDLRLDDLSEGMGKLLSPVMEVFLMSFSLQCNLQTGLELCFKHTSAESKEKLLVWSFEKTFSVDSDFCKRVWDFFRQNYMACSEVPKGMRKLVCISIQPPVEELKFVGKKWSEYASRIVRNQKAIRPKSDVKILHPMYVPMPLEYLPAIKSGTFPLQGSFDSNDVVMIAAYRNSIGNRRFRQTVSQFRALYSRLPPNKQSIIADKIIRLIQRRGGSFYSKNGYLAIFEESVAFTQKALENGFPEMMHPVIPAEAKSVVSGVEFTRMVDILADRKESINRVQRMMIESLSKAKDASAEKTNSSLNGRRPTNREGQPIDISSYQQSQLKGRQFIRGSGKRKKDRAINTNDGTSKRPRK
ncbi:unnamed protein product [Cylindrotheca closterium]|uniref:Uncharacterized protein n=1 Tax=Cylindrotheca closterium TaxID=2856 RepID=A0AAD2CK49_9STRA|nr:unnamed protein product [Cylindrotheca closterium]